MVGLEIGKVKVVPYDAEWPKRFEEEKKALLAALHAGGLDAEVEHVGSTAVPNMPAKPILDVALGFRDVASVGRAVKLLLDAGLVYVKGANQPGMLFMAKGTPRVMHAHLVVRTTNAWRKLIVFRDHLRRHPELAAEYGAVKTALAKEHADERTAYTEGKRAVLEAILARAYFESRQRRHAAVLRRGRVDELPE